MITPIARRCLAALIFCVTLAAAGIAAPAITSQPAGQSVVSGAAATFTVAATGSGTLTYQWQRNGLPLAGATAATYSVAAATRADADYYSVVVNDTSGTPTASTVARLSVAPTATALIVAADPAWNLQLEALNAVITASVPLSDGGYYVTGNFTTVGSTRQTTIMRVAADGSRNASFTPPEFDATINTLVVQADGKVVVGGNFARIGGYLRPRLARLNADGTLDLAYNPGLAINATGVTSLALQADGKVLAAANTTLLRYNPDGSRDSSYTPTFNSIVQVIALQSDGRAIAAGGFTTVTNNSVATAKNNVARLNTDGSVDTTFDVGTGTAGSSPFAVAIQTDGKILVGGGFTTFAGTTTRLARVNATGALDSAFVTAGGTGFNTTVNALALDSAQNILVGGAFATFNAVARANFARLLPTGALDTTFVLASALNGTVSALSVGTDSKLLLGGSFTALGATARVALARLNIDATLDTAPNFTFRSAGTVNAIVAAPGGKYLLGGFFNFARGVDVPDHLIRVDATGAVDPTFNSGGVGANNRVNAIALLGDGRIAIGGTFTTYNGTTRTRIALLTAAGVLDTTFAPAATGADNTVQALASLPNGRLALGGLFLNVNATARNRIAVLNLDGTLDTTFAPAGTGLNNTVNALTVQRDGKLLVGGTFTTYNTTTTVGQFARLNADGSLDTAFNTAAGTGFNSAVNSVALRSDGKIVVGGNFTTYNGAAHSGVNRLNADGTQDTFGTGSVNNVFAVASLEDGSIISRGNFFISASATSPALPYLERLAADGTRDVAFIPGGIESGGLTPAAILVRDNGQFLTSTSTTTQGIQATRAAALPTITTQPANQTATVGGSATFSVTATASAAPLSYQWLFNSQPIAGAVNATYTIASAQLANVGSYFVTVSSELGSVTSTAATLSGPAAAPVISVQPAATTAVAGGNVTFSVTASGADSYQWRRNGIALVGATAATYTITGAKQTDSDIYDVIAYAGLTPAASSTARLTVTPSVYPNGLRPDPAFNLNLDTTGAGAGVIRAVVRSGTNFYIAGDFTRISGSPRSRIARFTVGGAFDSTWNPSAFDGLIRALAVDANGDLIVAGDFNAIGGVSRTRLARISGTTGALDPTFIGYNGTNNTINALAVQADGKILIAGAFTTFASVSRIGLARLNSDGTPDLAYDAQLNGSASALLVLADGRLVVGGAFTTAAGTARGGLAVLLATGALDTTFAPTGTGFNGSVQALALDTAGKLLVGGSFTTFNAVTQNRLARLDFTGALDATLVVGTGVNNTVNAILPVSGGAFLLGGQFTTYNATARAGVALVGSTGTLDPTFNPGITGSTGIVNALALDSAGGLVVVGDFLNLGGAPRNRLGRVDPATGVLDATLNPAAAEFPASAIALAAQPGGKYLVASNATRVGGVAIPVGLFRLNADLTLDTSYNSGGAGIALSGTNGPGSILRLAVTPDGKTYLGAATMTAYNGVARSNFARINADGTLDSTFSVGAGFNGFINSIALLPGGQLLVAGSFTTNNGVIVNGLVRLNADGSRDTSLAPLAVSLSPSVVAAAPGGKIYVGGTFTSVSAPTATARNRIARLNADGTLDTTFDPGAGASANNTVTAITVLDDGRVLIGGIFSTVDNIARLGLARLATTGAVDRTFGTFLGNSNAGTNAITVLPDGRLLQRGSFLSLSLAPVVPGVTTATISSFGLARLSANGLPETTISVSSIGTLVQDANVILDDGRVLVAHANPSVATDGTFRAGLTLLIPQVGPGPGGVLRPVFVTAGQNAVSTTVFAGNVSGAVTYLWRKNGTALAPSVDHVVGTNSRQLLWANAQATDAGSYDCVVTDGVGTFTTNAFTVAVAAAAPTVLAPTVNTVAVSSTTSPGLTYVEGTPVTLSASATGTAPITYQWQRNGANISGATATGLDLGTLTAANAGTYTLNATNTLGTVASSAVTLTLANGSAIAPVILQNPTQQTTALGAATGFTVTAGGTGTLSYQWKKDGVVLTSPTATTAMIVIPSVGLADVGLYSVDVTNATGTTTSAAVRLSVGNASVWTWRHALPYGGAYAKTAFGAGRYVAVGYAGAISTSADAVTWTLNSQIGSAFLDIVYASGRFVAVGSFGAVITSIDGLNWTRQNIATATGNNLNSVIYDGTRYVAVGDDRVVYSSPDGATWTLRAAPFPASNTVATSLRSIAFGNGTYVIHTFRAVYTSTDLATWTASPVAFSDVGSGIYSVIFSGGNFYASGDFGDFFRSTDNGATWTFGSVDSVNTTTNGESWISIASSGTRLVSVNSSGSVATSTDGLTWNIVTNFPVSLTNFNGVSYVNNQFIAVGNGGMIFTSPDGLAWTRRTAAPLGLAQWNAVTAGPSGFVAVGNSGQLASSADGLNWISRDSGTGNNFGGVTFGGGKYVAVQGVIAAYSSDGATWADVSAGTGSTAALNAVTYDGSQFVAVGTSGRVATTPDGINWTNRTSGQTTALRGVAAGTGALVAVGDTALIIRSTDAGVTWTPATVPAPLGTTTTLRAVTYAGGQFVAVGFDQVGQIISTVILTSPDGTTWTRSNVPYTQSGRSIVYANGRYSVGGGSLSILNSTDGITWTAETSNNAQLILGLANSTAGYVAVGSGGGIQYASNSPAPAVTALTPITGAGGVTVALTGTGFTGATGVTFNGTAAASFTVVSDTSATAVTPAVFTSGPVTVSGPGGTSLPTVAYTVFAPPVIATQPAPQTVNQNASVTFTVVATGATPLSYQWKKGTTNVGTNSASFTIPSAQAADAATYSVVVTNADGTATSVGATLTVVILPVITAQPASLTVTNGDPAAFSVTATGTPTLTYQWRKNGTAVPGATATTYTLAPATLADTGASFTVVVTNAAGSATSSAAILTVLPTRHSADSNADLKISLAEFTRVIELYNATVAGVRTGEYRTAAGTEDLFAPGPGAITAGFHSADSNKDGRLSLAELTRVIELYNYKNGAGIRTGEYHTQSGTEDGFAPAP